MEIDPVGTIAECLRKLTAAGFDATAYESSRWIGLAVLAVFVLLLVAQAIAHLKGRSGPLIEPKLAILLLLVGAGLVALPVISRVSGNGHTIEYVSHDAEWAKQICGQTADQVAQSAQTEALAAQLEAIRGEIAQLGPALRALQPGSGVVKMSDTLSATSDSEMAPFPWPPGGSSLALVSSLPLLGEPISVFYRPERATDALAIASQLKQEGAGVAIRETILSESTLSTTAQAGEVFVIHAADKDDTVATVARVLNAQDQIVTDVRGPYTLRGNPVQILLF
jgi:hypothetical protein